MSNKLKAVEACMFNELNDDQCNALTNERLDYIERQVDAIIFDFDLTDVDIIAVSDYYDRLIERMQ